MLRGSNATIIPKSLKIWELPTNSISLIVFILLVAFKFWLKKPPLISAFRTSYWKPPKTIPSSYPDNNTRVGDLWAWLKLECLCLKKWHVKTFSHQGVLAMVKDLAFWLHWVLNTGWCKRTLKHFRYQCMCLKKWYLKSFFAPNCLDLVKILGLDLALIISWGIYFLWLGWGEKMMKPVFGGSWLLWRSSSSRY